MITESGISLQEERGETKSRMGSMCESCPFKEEDAKPSKGCKCVEVNITPGHFYPGHKSCQVYVEKGCCFRGIVAEGMNNHNLLSSVDYIISGRRSLLPEEYAVFVDPKDPPCRVLIKS